MLFHSLWLWFNLLIFCNASYIFFLKIQKDNSSLNSMHFSCFSQQKCCTLLKCGSIMYSNSPLWLQHRHILVLVFWCFFFFFCITTFFIFSVRIIIRNVFAFQFQFCRNMFLLICLNSRMHLHYVIYNKNKTFKDIQFSNLIFAMPCGYRY